MEHHLNFMNLWCAREQTAVVILEHTIALVFDVRLCLMVIKTSSIITNGFSIQLAKPPFQQHHAFF